VIDDAINPLAQPFQVVSVEPAGLRGIERHGFAEREPHMAEAHLCDQLHVAFGEVGREALFIVRAPLGVPVGEINAVFEALRIDAGKERGGKHHEDRKRKKQWPHAGIVTSALPGGKRDAGRVNLKLKETRDKQIPMGKHK